MSDTLLIIVGTSYKLAPAGEVGKKDKIAQTDLIKLWELK